LKQQLWTIVKTLAKTLVIVIAVDACLRYLGDFSAAQSNVLTGLGWLGYGLAASYAQRHGQPQGIKNFSPFCVSIQPNWYSLLLDFKLVGGKEEWERFCEAMDKKPAGEYSIFRSGILFTVIGPQSEDGMPPGLIYSDNHKRFASGADFSEGIMELEFGRPRRGEHPFFKHPLWANLPEVFFKRGADGYDLGLEVQQDWWKDLCASGGIGDLANIEPDTDYLCGTTRLVIATLPYSELRLYSEPNDYEQMKARQPEIDKQLEAKGWKRQVEKNSDIPDPWWRIDHKYFAVAHREI
jgi:hypothetical protein